MTREPNNIDVQVGIRLRLLRQAAKMSQQELADEVGVSFQQIQKYEKGTNRISVSRLVEITRYLDAPITELFRGVETPDSEHTVDILPDELQELIQSHDGVKFAEALAQITDRGLRTSLLAHMRELAHCKRVRGR